MDARTTAKWIFGWATAVAVFLLASREAHGQRIRDIARVKGDRPQHLTGLGLVIGLAGTGDSQQNELKSKLLETLVRNLGVSVPLKPTDIKSKNTALVVVSATVSSTLKVNSEFDVKVSSLGDAASLRGGHLLAVPLRGPTAVEYQPGEASAPFYAIAQGDVVVDREGADKVTLARSQAILTTAIEEDLSSIATDQLTLILLEPDFSTAAQIASRINAQEIFRETGGASVGPLAVAPTSGLIRVRVSNHYLQEDRVVGFISRVLDIEIPGGEGEALISINNQTGAVVINGAVRVAASAVVSYKGAMVRIPSARAAGAPGEATLADDNPLLIDVVDDLKSAAFTSKDIASVLRELHSTRAIIGKLVER